MPYSSTANDPHTEIGMLRDEITKEVNGDAEVLADQVFREQRPDFSRVSNEQYDQAILQKLQAGDRAWLNSEAQRDPNQFIASRDRLIKQGKIMDPSKPQQHKTPGDAVAAAQPMQPPAPEIPATPSMPLMPPAMAPAAPAPMPQLGPPMAPSPAPLTAGPAPAAPLGIPPGPVPPY